MLEFQYFDGCPNSATTLGYLQELIAERVIAEKEIIITKINPSDFALNFLGSPTILINGTDIYTGQKPRGFNYSCRIFEFDGRRTGVIPKKFIREKINQSRLRGKKTKKAAGFTDNCRIDV